MLPASTKRVYPILQCPMPDCEWAKSRLDRHLVHPNGHALAKDSEAYKEAMNRASIVEAREPKPAPQTKYGWFEVLAAAFEKHVRSFQGKNLTSENAATYVAEIRKIVTFYMKGGEIYTRLLCKLEDIGDVDEGWVHHAVNNDGLAHETVNNYLMALNLFYDFLETNKTYMNLWAKDLTAYRLKLAATMRNLSRASSAKRGSKLKKKKEDRVDPSLFIRYHASPYYQEMIDALVLNPQNETRFVELRNFLCFELILLCGRRGGDLAELTSEEFASGVRDGDSMVITISKHKTMRTYSGANLVLDGELYRALTAYMLHLRKLARPTCNRVFVTATGTPMSPSLMNKAINQHWQGFTDSAGMPRVHISANKLHHSAVTLSRERGGMQLHKDLSRHMSHSVQVAESYYDVSRGRTESIRSAKFLRSVYVGIEGSESQGEPEEQTSQQEHPMAMEDVQPAPTSSSEEEPRPSTSGLNLKLAKSPSPEAVGNINRPPVARKEVPSPARVRSVLRDTTLILDANVDYVEKLVAMRDMGPKISTKVIRKNIKSKGQHYRYLLALSDKQLWDRVSQELKKKLNLIASREPPTPPAKGKRP